MMNMNYTNTKMKTDSMKIHNLEEPKLKFFYDQDVVDPRDGLTIFGPYTKGKVNNFSVGIIGTGNGILRAKEWIFKLHKPIYNTKHDYARPFFPDLKKFLVFLLILIILLKFKLIHHF